MQPRWMLAAALAWPLTLGVCESRGADPLVDAAAARQQAIQSADIEFHLKAFYTKGYLSGMKLPGSKPPAPVPSADTTLEADNRLLIDGMRVRFEDKLPIWHVRTGELTKGKTCLSVSNGELAKRFFPAGIGTDDKVSGFIARDGRCEQIKESYLTPLTTFLRGLEPAFAPYPVQKLKKTGRVLLIAGSSCEEYSMGLSADLTIAFWFDSQASYTLRRIQKIRRGLVTEQSDVHYQSHSQLGSVPSSWLMNQFDQAGKVVRSVEVTVTAFRLNPSPPAELFEIEFPPGCEVFDERTTKYYRIQPSGDMREVTSSGQELPNVIPQPGVSWVRRNIGLLIGLAALLMVSVFYVVRRVRNRGRAP